MKYKDSFLFYIELVVLLLIVKIVATDLRSCIHIEKAQLIAAPP